MGYGEHEYEEANSSFVVLGRINCLAIYADVCNVFFFLRLERIPQEMMQAEAGLIYEASVTGDPASSLSP